MKTDLAHLVIYVTLVTLLSFLVFGCETAPKPPPEKVRAYGEKIRDWNYRQCLDMGRDYNLKKNICEKK